MPVRSWQTNVTHTRSMDGSIDLRDHSAPRWQTANRLGQYPTQTKDPFGSPAGLPSESNQKNWDPPPTAAPIQIIVLKNRRKASRKDRRVSYSKWWLTSEIIPLDSKIFWMAHRILASEAIYWKPMTKFALARTLAGRMFCRYAWPTKKISPYDPCIFLRKSTLRCLQIT